MAIKTLSEYTKVVEDACSKGSSYLFRGQRKCDSLLPRFLRDDVNPKNKQTAMIEEKMFKDFKRRGRPFVKIEPQNEYEWLALAQHHGMATRFLDWTSSALAALWFTVTSKREIDDDGVVWRLKFEEENLIYPEEKDLPYKSTKTKIFYPTHIEQRFSAQGGWFTVHNYKDYKIPLNEEIEFKDKLQALTIKRSSFDEIRISLNRCGINKLSLFPDFGGLCDHINWINFLI